MREGIKRGEKTFQYKKKRIKLFFSFKEDVKKMRIYLINIGGLDASIEHKREKAIIIVN